MAAAQAPDGLTIAARTRRGQLLGRLAIAGVTCLVLNRIVGWTPVAIWMAAYTAVQLLEFAIFAPVFKDAEARLPFWRKTLGCGAMLLGGVIFGSLSIPLWTLGGPMGGLCAALLLTAAITNGVVHTPASALALGCVLTPQVVYLNLSYILMQPYNAGRAYEHAVLICALTVSGFSLVMWRALERNRTAELAARAESERKRLEAERATAAKSVFVATVSHELRTPITAMLAGAAELQRTAADANARANAALIADAGRMMKTLLDELLDHSKIEAGAMTVEATPFDLRAATTQLVRFWSNEAAKKGLKLRVEGAASLPARVVGDPTRLRQILNNLLSNALKFTSEGGVTLKLSAWAAEDDAYSVRFQVSDTGEGMDREQLSRLFTPFAQADDTIARRHGGTGLGLAISRELAHLMGGQLTVASVKGEGSTFTFALDLPRAPADARLEALEEPAPPPVLTPSIATPAKAAAPAVDAVEPLVADAVSDEEERPLRVLVTDDHEVNRRAMTLMLNPLGAVITTACNGLEALEAAQAETFDVILMDVRMPGMDGREASRRIRAMEGPNQATPIIAVTADGQVEDIAACKAAGMTGFVSKPVEAPTLYAALEAALGGDDEAEDDGRQVA
jgi:signal transduction histidine kinase/ActR/RegA family two-component response regulator